MNHALRSFASLAAAAGTALTVGACADDFDDAATFEPVTAAPPAALAQSASLWPGHNVRVCYAPETRNDALLARMRWLNDHIGWSAVADINLTGWGPCPNLGVALSPKYIRIRFAPGTDGMTSPRAGYPLGAFTTVTIGDDLTTDHFDYEALHELGHALGFGHEQQRPENWVGGGHPMCDRFQQGESAITLSGFHTAYYDTQSIMDYCLNVSVFAQQLSPGDVTIVQAAYGRRTPVGSGQNPSSAMVARTPSNLDSFFVHSDGRLWTSYWFDGIAAGPWPSFPISAGSNTARPGEQVAAVARTPDNLDVFYAGNGGALLSAYWAGGGWTEFTVPFTEGKVLAGSKVSAVASSPGQIDVAFAATDGNLWWAHWRGQFPGVNGWEPVSVTHDGAVPVGAAVSLIAPRPDQLDAFWIGAEGQLHMATCTGMGKYGTCESQNGWVQAPVTTSTECAALAGAPVSAVARTPDTLDVFWTNAGGAICNAEWTTTNATWPARRITAPGVNSWNGQLGVVARTPYNLDLFWVNPNNQLQTMWWYGGASGYDGMVVQNVYGGTAAPGAAIGVTARKADILDVVTLGATNFRTTSLSTAYWTPGTGWQGYQPDGY